MVVSEYIEKQTPQVAAATIATITGALIGAAGSLASGVISALILKSGRDEASAPSKVTRSRVLVQNCQINKRVSDQELVDRSLNVIGASFVTSSQSEYYISLDNQGSVPALPAPEDVDSLLKIIYKTDYVKILQDVGMGAKQFISDTLLKEFDLKGFWEAEITGGGAITLFTSKTSQGKPFGLFVFYGNPQQPSDPGDPDSTRGCSVQVVPLSVVDNFFKKPKSEVKSNLISLLETQITSGKTRLAVYDAGDATGVPKSGSPAPYNTATGEGILEMYGHPDIKVGVRIAASQLLSVTIFDPPSP